MQLCHLNGYAIFQMATPIIITRLPKYKRTISFYSHKRDVFPSSLSLFQIVTMPLNPVSQAFVHQVALPVCVCVFVAETEVPNLTASER